MPDTAFRGGVGVSGLREGETQLEIRAANGVSALVPVRVRPWITDLTIAGGEYHRVAYTVSGDKRSFTVKGTVTTDMPDKYSTCVFQSLTLPAGTYTLRDSVFSPSRPERTYVRIGTEGTSDDSQFTLEAGTYQLAFATRATVALDLTVTPVLTKLG